MTPVTSAFPAKWPSACAYIGCDKGNRIQPGELMRLEGERRPRNENTKRVGYHAVCWSKLRESNGTSAVPVVDVTDEDTQHGATLTTVQAHEGTDLASLIAQAVAPLMQAPKADVDESKVIDLIKRHAGDFVHPIRVEVSNQGEVKQLEGFQHFMFPRLLAWIPVAKNVLIKGPTQSGKSTACANAAEALGLQYYFVGMVTSEYTLSGFMNATGQYTGTPFRTWYEHGGLMEWPEMDAWDPKALLWANNAIANGHCQFPNAMITRHPDARLVATVNTWGLGATSEYVGRNKLDAASLARFGAKLNWEYDEVLETAVSGDPRWAARVQTIRRRVLDAGIKVVISPRCSVEGARALAAGISQDVVEHDVLRNGMSDTDWARVSGKSVGA